MPSHPAQLYEAIGTAAVVVLVFIAGLLGLFRARDGSRLLAGLAGWLAVRALVATTWRDPAILGMLPAGCLLAVALTVVALAALVDPRARAVDARRSLASR